jgi:hypothetical protein
MGKMLTVKTKDGEPNQLLICVLYRYRLQRSLPLKVYKRLNYSSSVSILSTSVLQATKGAFGIRLDEPFFL